MINLAPPTPPAPCPTRRPWSAPWAWPTHIPVDWHNPGERPRGLCRRHGGAPSGKTLIHCAANYRVTAFYSLYALEHLGWTVEEAEAFRASVWSGSDYPVWEAFVARVRERIVRRAPDA